MPTAPSTIPSVDLPGSGTVRPSAAADRVMAVARLSAAEHGSPTVHLLAALLDEPTTDAGTGTGTDMSSVRGWRRASTAATMMRTFPSTVTAGAWTRGVSGPVHVTEARYRADSTFLDVR
jgi:hypothetical protein